MKKSMVALLSLVLGELVAPAAFAAGWDATKVESYKACVKCHEKQVDVWKTTKHMKGYEDLAKSDKAKSIAEKMGESPKKIKKSELCSGCHFTLQDKNGTATVISGVSCESCHGPAKDWLEVHNDFGGKGVKREFEAPAHQAERFGKLDGMGMTYPGNIYGFAKNCYSCHIVAREKLVNDTEHAPGSDFDFTKRTQGDIRHGPPASKENLRKMQVVGYAVELELSLNALAKAGGGKYADKMRERAFKALVNLQDINKRVNQADVKTMAGAVSGDRISAGNGALAQAAATIAKAAQNFSKNENGQSLAALDNRQPVAAGSIPAAAAPNAQQPESKPAAASAPVKTPEKTKAPTPATETVAAAEPVPLRPTPTPPPVVKPPKDKPKQDVLPEVDLVPVPQAETGTGPMFSQFEIIAPNSVTLCNVNEPYYAGERKVQAEDKLTSDACYSLRFQAVRNAKVFVYNQTDAGSIIRLLPNECNALGLGFNDVVAGQRVSLPQNNKKQTVVLGLQGNPGREYFYLVAAGDSAAESQLAAQTGQIPDVCATSATNAPKISVEEFTETLNNLKNQSNQQLQWESRGFIHE